MSLPHPYPLLVVLGPTGSGKSALALSLAKPLSGEIVNFDSVQVYLGLDVGSAKLPSGERAGVTHHMIDVANPATDVTAGAYARQARRILEEITSRECLPILTGGTGFYLRALLDGLSPAPLRNQELRARLQRVADRRPLALSRLLRRLDGASAARIHAHDLQKLIRAIEMTALARRPASELQSVPRDSLQGFRILKIGLLPDRAALQARLNSRTEWMFSHGLLGEAAALLTAGVPPHAKALLSLGYKQAVAHLRGELSLPDAIAECQTRTRQYAKRQITWFRSEPDVHWLLGFGADPDIQTAALRCTREFLAQAPSC